MTIKNLLEGDRHSDIEFMRMQDALLASHIRRYYLDICNLLGVESLQLTVDGQKMVEQAVTEITHATQHHLVTSAPEGTLLN